MSTQTFVRFPDNVWHAIREFEPFEGFTALSVDVRAKVAEAPKVEISQPPLGVVRVVVLASNEADELLEWLDRRAPLPRVGVRPVRRRWRGFFRHSVGSILMREVVGMDRETGEDVAFRGPYARQR